MAKNTCLIPNNTERTTISPKIAKRLHNFFFIIIYFFCLTKKNYYNYLQKSQELFKKKEENQISSSILFLAIKRDSSYQEELIFPHFALSLVKVQALI